MGISHKTIKIGPLDVAANLNHVERNVADDKQWIPSRRGNANVSVEQINQFLDFIYQSICFFCILFNLNDRIAMNNYDASEWHAPELPHMHRSVFICLFTNARTHAPLNENIYSFSSPSLCLSFSSREINKNRMRRNSRTKNRTHYTVENDEMFLFRRFTCLWCEVHSNASHRRLLIRTPHFTDWPMARVRFDNRDFPWLRLTHYRTFTHWIQHMVI